MAGNRSLKNGIIIAAFAVLMTAAISSYANVERRLDDIDRRLARIEGRQMGSAQVQANLP